MEKVKYNTGKIFIISIVCSVLDVVLHAIFAPTYSYTPPSYFLASGLFRPFAGISLIIIFFSFRHSIHFY